MAHFGFLFSRLLKLSFFSSISYIFFPFLKILSVLFWAFSDYPKYFLNFAEQKYAED